MNANISAAWNLILTIKASKEGKVLNNVIVKLCMNYVTVCQNFRKILFEMIHTSQMSKHSSACQRQDGGQCFITVFFLGNVSEV